MIQYTNKSSENYTQIDQSVLKILEDARELAGEVDEINERTQSLAASTEEISASAMEIRKLEHPDAAWIPIIALTANDSEADIQKTMKAGMNAHLSKPVQPGDLFHTLEQLL